MTAKFQFRRQDVRSKIAEHTIKGIAAKQDKHFPFLIWDISDKGLGIWSTEELQNQDRITLQIASPMALSVECEVRWCKKLEDPAGYHIGVQVVGEPAKLETLHGLFTAAKSKETTSKTGS